MAAHRIPNLVREVRREAGVKTEILDLCAVAGQWAAKKYNRVEDAACHATKSFFGISATRIQ